jgi:hypothetical protein
VPRTVTAARPRAGRELALLASLYLAYSVARLMTDADLGTATGNAWALLRVEGAVHLDVERSLNDALTAVPGLPLLASYWYSVLHYVVTPAVLVWVYRAHPDRYGVARNALVIGSALGIVGFALLPMAPPRMLPGFVDTLAATSGSGWWGADASAPRGLGGLVRRSGLVVHRGPAHQGGSHGAAGRRRLRARHDTGRPGDGQPLPVGRRRRGSGDRGRRARGEGLGQGRSTGWEDGGR